MLKHLRWLVVRGGVFLLVVFVTLLIIELGLLLAGIEPVYHPNVQLTFDEAKQCDEARGCYWDYDLISDRCQTPYHQGTTPDVRYCYVNEDGLFGDVPFVMPPEPSRPLHRVMFMGDSTTFGYTASIGQSWAEVAGQYVADQDVLIWNTAFPGVGTSHAIAAARHYGPQLQPQVMILGFNLNDYYDNLLPLDQWVTVRRDNADEPVWIRRYYVDEQFEPVFMPDALLYYRLQGVDVVYLSPLVRLMMQTRVGTVLLPSLFNLQIFTDSPAYFERPEGWLRAAIEQTDTQLGELKAIADSLDARLIALIIPDYWLVDAQDYVNSETYRLLEKHGIPYVRVDDLLTQADYQNANPADKHWNNQAHGKVGNLMGDCLRYMILNDYALCPNVQSP